MSLDGVFQLIWYQFVFRLRFNLCSFACFKCIYTTLDVVFSSTLFTLFLTLIVWYLVILCKKFLVVLRFPVVLLFIMSCILFSVQSFTTCIVFSPYFRLSFSST